MKAQSIRNVTLLCMAALLISMAGINQIKSDPTGRYASEMDTIKHKYIETESFHIPLFELLYFDAIWNGHEIIINWDAVNELALVGYQIERIDGEGNFKRIGWEYSREISREVFYEFVDEDVEPGRSYFYRLKMVEFDGSISYSPVIKELRLVQ